MSERSLESLIMVNQELRLYSKFKASEKLIELYSKVFSKKRPREQDQDQNYIQGDKKESLPRIKISF